MRRLAWIFLLGFPWSAQAHIMGSSTWCLANSPVHFECQFEDYDLCQQTAQKKSKTNFETWQCVPYPIDMRNIPKSGETPVSNSPPSSSANSTKPAGH